MKTEKLFRLKREALPFFNKKYATCNYRMITWESEHIHPNALEEVEPIHIIYGIKKSDCSSDLSGWSDETTKLHFTVAITGTTLKEHDAIIDGINMRELMAEFQAVLNNRFLKN